MRTQLSQKKKVLKTLIQISTYKVRLEISQRMGDLHKK